MSSLGHKADEAQVVLVLADFGIISKVHGGSVEGYLACMEIVYEREEYNLRVVYDYNDRCHHLYVIDSTLYIQTKRATAKAVALFVSHFLHYMDENCPVLTKIDQWVFGTLGFFYFMGIEHHSFATVDGGMLPADLRTDSNPLSLFQ